MDWLNLILPTFIFQVKKGQAAKFSDVESTASSQSELVLMAQEQYLTTILERTETNTLETLERIRRAEVKYFENLKFLVKFTKKFVCFFKLIFYNFFRLKLDPLLFMPESEWSTKLEFQIIQSLNLSQNIHKFLTITRRKSDWQPQNKPTLLLVFKILVCCKGKKKRKKWRGKKKSG